MTFFDFARWCANGELRNLCSFLAIWWFLENRIDNRRRKWLFVGIWPDRFRHLFQAKPFAQECVVVLNIDLLKSALSEVSIRSFLLLVELLLHKFSEEIREFRRVLLPVSFLLSRVLLRPNLVFFGLCGFKLLKFCLLFLSQLLSFGFDLGGLKFLGRLLLVFALAESALGRFDKRL